VPDGCHRPGHHRGGARAARRHGCRGRPIPLGRAADGDRDGQGGDGGSGGDGGGIYNAGTLTLTDSRVNSNDAGAGGGGGAGGTGGGGGNGGANGGVGGAGGKGGAGGRVKSRKQAIAIGLSEARKKGAKVPRKRTGRRK
jgi:hypothetical protein